MNILKKGLALALTVAALGGTLVSQAKAAPYDLSTFYNERTKLVYSDHRNGGTLHGYHKTAGIANTQKLVAGRSSYYRHNAHEARIKHDRMRVWSCSWRYDEGWANMEIGIDNDGVRGNYFEFDGGDIW